MLYFTMVCLMIDNGNGVMASSIGGLPLWDNMKLFTAGGATKIMI